MSFAVLASALALAAVPPPAGGPWQQLGATVASRPGKQVHFFRTAARSPQALAVVVASSSAQRIRLYWWSYCEFESDDAPFQESSSTVTGVHAVTAYPPVLAGATLCYVSVNAGTSRGAAVSAAVFSH